jgi:CRISPR-associated protein (TIGR03986 family)
MDVLFRETNDGSVKDLCKRDGRKTEGARLTLKDLELIRSGEREGYGVLHKGKGEQDHYLETKLPLKKGHKVMKFFRVHDKPAIPPTSIKGMIRNIAEALSNSCFSQFDINKRLCHRQIGYGGRATPAIILSKSEGSRSGKIGLLDDENNHYHAWIPAYHQHNNMIVTSNNTGDPVFVTIVRSRHPRRNFSYCKVIDIKNNFHTLNGSSSDKYQGILKITGQNVEGKHDERVFFSKKYQTDLGDRYLQFCNDKSNWATYLGKLKQKDFNLKPQNDFNELIEEQENRRKLSHEPGAAGITIEKTKHTKLSVGDLVYAYFDDNQNLTGMFPVLVPLFWDQNSPYDLLCDLSGDLKPCNDLKSLCPCCRLFGMVSGDELGQALAGKVAFTLAWWTNDKEPSWVTKTLQMLNTPHPTCEQFYLVDEPNNTRVVRYDDRFGQKVGKLRGRKFYLHQQQINDEYAYAKVIDRMNSTVELLTEGTFKFTVDFHNLTDYELGLLLYALELESDLRHKLGMGKPLGLGSVKITIDKLLLINREERYRAILSDGIRNEQEYKYKFIQNGFKKVQAGEQTDNIKVIEQAFNNLPYIQDLKVILAFKDFYGLEIKYPRARSKRDGKPYGYEWFQQNKKKPLPTAQEVNSNDQRKVLDGWS